MASLKAFSDYAYCDRCYLREVCPSACLSITLVHPSKAVGRNEMPFDRFTCVVQSNILLGRGTGFPTGRGDLGVEIPVSNAVSSRAITTPYPQVTCLLRSGLLSYYLNDFAPCYVICLSLCMCVRPLVMLLLPYLWLALMDFHQTFISSASWEKDELFRFWVQKVKDQGSSITRFAVNTIFRVCSGGAQVDAGIVF